MDHKQWPTVRNKLWVEGSGPGEDTGKEGEGRRVLKPGQRLGLSRADQRRCGRDLGSVDYSYFMGFYVN